MPPALPGDCYLREVHHRIENNLQGVAGILRRLARSHPSLREPITDAISRLQGIAVVHGIQGPAASGVPLCELARSVAENTEALWQQPVKVAIECLHGDCVLADSEAVPMALVLNELLANAAKHGEEGSGVELTARFEPHPSRARLTIRNKGWLPEGFSPELQMGFGDGLQLVSALLPRSGVEIKWDQEGAWVTVTLQVSPPVLAGEQQTEKTHEFNP